MNIKYIFFIILISSNVIFTSLYSQIPKENLIAEYLFEKNNFDNSGNNHHLNSKIFNERQYSDIYYPSRISGQFAYKKITIFDDTCVTVGQKLCLNFQHDTVNIAKFFYKDGYSISYWTHNNGSNERYYSTHMTIHNSLSIRQYPRSFSALESIGTKYGFPLKSIGRAFTVPLCCYNSNGASGSYELNWRNIVYTFSKKDSLITKFENGIFADRFQLDSNLYKLIFVNKLNIKIIQDAGIEMDSHIYDRGIDDILIFNKTLSPSEINSIQTYPAAVITNNETVKLDNNSIRVYSTPEHSKVMVTSSQNNIDKIDLLNLNGMVMFSAANIFNRQYEMDVKSLPQGVYLLKIATQAGGVISKKFIKE